MRSDHGWEVVVSYMWNPEKMNAREAIALYNSLIVAVDPEPGRSDFPRCSAGLTLAALLPAHSAEGLSQDVRGSKYRKSVL